MNERLTEQSCTAFAAALASKAPVPGGGGAAALTGALSAALCSMVGNFTVGRKKDPESEADLQWLLERAECLRERLLELVEQDAAAFMPLSQAYAIPKDNPFRAETLERRTLDACAAPIQMMEACCETVELLEVLLDQGSAMLISDVGCGALCCMAALESAGMNVFVNTRTLRDRTAAAELDNRADGMLKRYLPRARNVADEVSRRLRN